MCVLAFSPLCANNLDCQGTELLRCGVKDRWRTATASESRPARWLQGLGAGPGSSRCDTMQLMSVTSSRTYCTQKAMVRCATLARSRVPYEPVAAHAQGD